MVALVKSAQFGVRGGVQRQIVQRRQVVHMAVQIAIGFDGHELAANGQPVQRLAQVLARSALDVGRIGHQGIERAILQQPFGSRFGAYLVHAGDVVGGIAHQGLKVDHQLRRHAKFVLHASSIAALAGHGVDHGDVRVNKLAQVLVAAGDDDVDILAGRGFGQRADYVVCLDPFDGEHFPALQPHHFVDGGDLAAQVVRHGRAVRLVVGIQRVAKRFAFGIEHASRPGGGVFACQRLQHVDHDAQRARGLAAAIGQGDAPVPPGMKGAVQIAGAIYQQQQWLGRRGGGGRIGMVGLHPGIVHGF